MRSNLLKRCDIWVKEYNFNANILLLSPKLKPPEKASDMTFGDFLRLKVHNPLGWKVIWQNKLLNLQTDHVKECI